MSKQAKNVNVSKKNASKKNDASESQIIIASDAKNDAKQATTANVVKRQAIRVTIFKHSLTSAVKAMRNELNLTSDDVKAVVARLANRDDYAASSVTTAYSDAANVKYCKKQAEFSDDERTTIAKTLKAIASEAKAKQAK